MLEYTETENTMTGMKGTTKVHETYESAVGSAKNIGDSEYREDVMEYGGGYIVIAHLRGGEMMMPASRELAGRIFATAPETA